MIAEQSEWGCGAFFGISEKRLPIFQYANESTWLVISYKPHPFMVCAG